MPILKNPRHEAFAVLFATGLHNAFSAYESVYGEKANKNVNEVNGCRLLKNAQVSSRIVELQAEKLEKQRKAEEKAAEKFVWSMEDKVKTLKEIAMSNGEYRNSVVRTSDRAKALELAGRFQGQLMADLPKTEVNIHVTEVQNVLNLLRNGEFPGESQQKLSDEREPITQDVEIERLE